MKIKNFMLDASKFAIFFYAFEKTVMMWILNPKNMANFEAFLSRSFHQVEISYF